MMQLKTTTYKRIEQEPEDWKSIFFFITSEVIAVGEYISLARSSTGEKLAALMRLIGFRIHMKNSDTYVGMAESQI